MAANIDLLTALPTSLTHSVLTNWLELKDVSHLDSALSNNALRPLFLDMLRSAIFINLKWKDAYDSDIYKNDFVQWLIARSIIMEELDLDDVKIGHVRKLLNQARLHLTSVRIHDSHHLSLVAEQCSKLQRCEYTESVIDAPVLYRLLANNANMQHLELSGEFVPKTRGNQRFEEVACPHLRVLSVIFNHGTEEDKLEAFALPLILSITAQTEKLYILTFFKIGWMSSDAVVKLLPQFHHLRTLFLPMTTFAEGDLRRIAALCPGIVNLDLTAGRNVTDADVEHLAQHLQLRFISLCKCKELTVASLNSLLNHSHATLTTLNIIDTFTGTANLMPVTMAVGAVLTACKLLTALCLNSQFRRDKCMQNLIKLHVHSVFITNKTLQVLAYSCVSVQFLYLEAKLARGGVNPVNIRLLLDKCSKLHTLVVRDEDIYSIVKRIIEKDYGNRVPTLHVSRHYREMKLTVLDMPVE